MKPLRRKLICVGNSRGVTIPKEYFETQKRRDGYILVLIPSDDEIRQRDLQ